MITIPELTAQALGSFLASKTRGRFGAKRGSGRPPGLRRQANTVEMTPRDVQAPRRAFAPHSLFNGARLKEEY